MGVVTANGINAFVGKKIRCLQLVSLELSWNNVGVDGAKMIADSLL